VPEAIQFFLEGATTREGKGLVDSANVPQAWNIEVSEERQDGLLLAVSPDPKATALAQSIQAYSQDERYPSGQRKRGTARMPAVERLRSPGDLVRLKLGDELLDEWPPDDGTEYVVDIEVDAGREHPEGHTRRGDFAVYLRDGGALPEGTHALIEDDYALFRTRVGGALLRDLVETHPWVQFVDRPPVLERQAVDLRSLTAHDLPNFEQPSTDAPVVTVLDGGVVPEHPLLRPALDGQHHQSFLPGNESVEAAPASDGHGTAVASLTALGGLREALLGGGDPVTVNRVAIARVLDDDAKLPDALNPKDVIPRAVKGMLDANRGRVVNHCLASRAPFNRQRMSVWAETLDRLAYDDGREGFLIVVASGNIDGQITPTLGQLEEWIAEGQYPAYLASDERCRLRNPAQAINALTVGAYVPQAQATFRDQQLHGLTPVAGPGAPSPFTRSGFGYLGEVKPEVVEEGGNAYVDALGRPRLSPRMTDVPVDNHGFARSEEHTSELQSLS